MTTFQVAALVYWVFGLLFVPWSLKTGKYAPIPFVWDSLLDIPLWLISACAWPVYAYAHWSWRTRSPNDT